MMIIRGAAWVVLAVVLCISWPAVARDTSAATEVNHRLCRGENCRTFALLADAAANARDGDRLIVAPGIHEEAFRWTACDTTISGKGAHLRGVAYGGKAAMVIRTGPKCTTTVTGIECSDIAVADRNGACIRLEGGNLVVRDVYFHDSEEGILASHCGSVLVEGSRFERLGKGGRAHGMYVECDSLTVRNSKILCSRDEGHGIKSGSRRTTIEDFTVIDSQTCDSSREIDIYCGGQVIIRDSLIRKGPASVQSNMIGIGKESGRCDYGGAAIIENNRFVSNASRRVIAIDSRIPVTGKNVRKGDFRADRIPRR